MPDSREYYVILREPGSEEGWDSYDRDWRTFDDPEPPTRWDSRGSAHHNLHHLLSRCPDSHAIVARVRERTVTEPGETVWAVRDAKGRYLRGDVGGWVHSLTYATRYSPRSAAINVLRNEYNARSIEPIGIGGTTRVEREILPEVDDA